MWSRNNVYSDLSSQFVCSVISVLRHFTTLYLLLPYYILIEQHIPCRLLPCGLLFHHQTDLYVMLSQFSYDTSLTTKVAKSCKWPNCFMLIHHNIDLSVGFVWRFRACVRFSWISGDVPKSKRRMTTTSLRHTNDSESKRKKTLTYRDSEIIHMSTKNLRFDGRRRRSNNWFRVFRYQSIRK